MPTDPEEFFYDETSRQGCCSCGGWRVYDVTPHEFERACRRHKAWHAAKRARNDKPVHGGYPGGYSRGGYIGGKRGKSQTQIWAEHVQNQWRQGMAAYSPHAHFKLDPDDWRAHDPNEGRRTAEELFYARTLADIRNLPETEERT